MNPSKDEGHTYHLIDLEGQEFFSGTGDEHQALRMNKTLLMNAIASQPTPQFGPAYDTPAAEHVGAFAPLDELQEILTTLGVETIESVAIDSAPAEFESTAHAVPDAVETRLSDADSAERLPEESFNVALATTLDSTLLATQSEDEFERLISGTVGHDTEYLLQDVQDTLGSLSGMANRLAEQKKDTLKQQKTLHGRDLALQDKERQLSEKEDDLRQLHKQLLQDRNQLTQEAENNARAVAERSSALQQLAESLEARERASGRRAELLQQENTRTEELSTQLRARLAQLHKREGELQRKGLELSESLKQLKSTKERFSAIVKSFNDSVQLGGEPHVIGLRADEDAGGGHVEPV